MKLQIIYQVKNPDDTLKKVTKTFSTVNESQSNEQFKDFALAYAGLVDASDIEVYLIKVAQI